MAEPDDIRNDVSVGQVAAFATFAGAFCLCGYARFLQSTTKASDNETADENDAESLLEKGSALPQHAPTEGEAPGLIKAVSPRGARGVSAFVTRFTQSPFLRVITLSPADVLAHKATIDAVAEFCAWMLWFYISDRTTALPYGAKSYSRDIFASVYAAIVMAAFVSSRTKEKKVMTLSRQQTEEWKGWMQVMFLLYHYFEAKEAYNLIRVLIAGYVWMTGYGNFHYYYRSNDYCVGRFAQMMWRLNFLVVCCCIVLRNSYMLYYICPMHTFFTVLVYAALGIASHVNGTRWGMALKLGGSLLFVLLLWDVEGVFSAVWRPLGWLVEYQDPRKEAGDRLHEWFFRSGLDRFVWIWGMVVAWLHPHIEAAWKVIDNLPQASRFTARAAIAAATATAAYLWYAHVYTLPKLEYNAVHPYTSWIPLTLWIVARNLTPALRSHSLALFGWLGCVTLETYIGQFHIWLRSNVPDGQPKWILDVIPGYQLANFLVCSLIYITVSQRLFLLTNTLKNAFVPHSDDPALAANAAMMALFAGAMYCIAGAFHLFLSPESA